MSTPEPSAPAKSGLPVAVVLLLAIGAAACLLALFQWMELLVVNAGGSTVCGVNDTINCEAVWSSSFAERLHRLTLVPVAGLGLVWGLVAFSLSLLLAHRLLSGGPARVPVVALRFTSAVGTLVCVTFAVASFRIGALCLTCLGTYAVTLAFTLVAFKLLPGPLEPAAGELRPALIWSAGLAVVGYLAVLGPGLATYKPAAGTGKSFPAAGGASAAEASDVERYLSSLPREEQLAVSESVALFKSSPTPDVSRFATRERKGPAEAPVRIVEFTDTLCGHCAQLLKVMKDLEGAVPDGRISVEPRHFPLAHECNKLVSLPDPSGVRCAGARAQICLEGTPEYWKLRDQIFEEQRTLTPERIIEIASSGSLKRDALVACMQSEQTQQKLNDDISYAARFKPKGTPIVVLNGRQGSPVPAFLYAMAMTGGDASSPAFGQLPPAPSSPSEGP